MHWMQSGAWVCGMHAACNPVLMLGAQAIETSICADWLVPKAVAPTAVLLLLKQHLCTTQCARFPGLIYEHWLPFLGCNILT